jgi:hypothetical protein
VLRNNGDFLFYPSIEEGKASLESPLNAAIGALSFNQLLHELLDLGLSFRVEADFAAKLLIDS